MPKPRDRAWRRSQRARHIQNRVREDLVPAVEQTCPSAIWQLHTPDGVPMPFFKRQQVHPSEHIHVGSTQVVKMRHACGCPLYEPYRWFNHFLQEWVTSPYTPTSEGCTPQCALYPGPAPVPYWWHPWPAAPAGFVWKVVRFTEPQERSWPTGKLGKWRRPKGKWSFTDASGRKHRVSGSGSSKNWKLLYTRPVKVLRAKRLGFQYHLRDDWEG